MTDERWTDLTGYVATMPGLAEALLAEHVPNADGFCEAPACGRPGYGTPNMTPWPCGLAGVAAAAVEWLRARPA